MSVKMEGMGLQRGEAESSSLVTAGGGDGLRPDTAMCLLDDLLVVRHHRCNYGLNVD